MIPDKHFTGKVALVINNFHGGGAERIMVTLANVWVAKGISVDFLVGKAEGPYQKELSENVRLTTFNTSIKGMLPGIIRYLKREEPDILLSSIHSVNVVATLAGFLSFSKTRIVLREANSPSKKLRSVKRWKTKLGYTLIARSVYHLAHGYISVSEGLKKDMVSFYRISSAKIKTIYNPVVGPRMYELAGQEVHHPWVSSDTPLLVAMGRVVPQKDFETLIRAFYLVQQKQNVHLLILGEYQSDPDYFQELQELILELKLKASIKFIGFHANPFPYLKAAKVFVLSSRFEGLPGVLIQALAMGCSIVSTDCPHGPAEILEGGKFGELVEVGDTLAMAKAIEQQLANSSVKSDYSKALSKFQVDAAAQEYLRYFCSVTKKALPSSQ